MIPANDGMANVLRDMCGGSVEAFDRFYDAYSPFIMKVALRMLNQRMEAEDVCHDVFIEVLHKGESYDPLRGSIEAWLAVKTRSRCLDRLRRLQRTSSEAEPDRQRSAPAIASPEELVLSRMQQEALRDALRTLPGHQRHAVVNNFLHAKTQRELSSELNVPLGTVKSWVRYGLVNLRKQLGKHGWITDVKHHREEGGQ